MSCLRQRVDNKFQNCEYSHPDGSPIRSQKVKMAEEIKEQRYDALRPIITEKERNG